MRASEFDVVFVGGGLASALCALALRSRRPGCRVALVERGATLGGNHTWCFHADDVPEAAWPFVRPLVARRWPGHTVRFPRRQRRVDLPYACITSERLHAVVGASLDATSLLLACEATRVDAREVTLADGRVLHASLVVDARGPEVDPSARSCGYQKFVGIELAVEPTSAEPAEPVLFDACVPQHDGFRFMYTLPLAHDRVLIEETFFSDDPTLREDEGVRAVLAHAEREGLRVRDVVRIERGVLPMPWRDDDFDPDARPLRAGYAAGLFHPVTGYSLPFAVRFALALAACAPDDPTLAPIRALAEAEARQRPFLRLLARLLFTAFAPDQRYRVIEHFYRLPDALIARFYAGDLRVVDRARIMIGAPPPGFSLGRALRGAPRALEVVS